MTDEPILDPGEFNPSSYTVTFTRTPIGWAFEAKHADGSMITPPWPGFYISKPDAERDALIRLERHARGADHEEINGFDLQKRIAERERTQTPAGRYELGLPITREG